jgi:SAM-dependent methyltransferase
VYTKAGALDLRLQRPKKYSYTFTLGTPLLPAAGVNFGALTENDAPEVRYSGFKVPHHLSSALLSRFPRAKTDHSLVLDLGCGNTIHRQACERAGFEYVGLDFESDEASILGDAHALPFQDESIEFLLSVAVLEHIRFPFVMMKEAYRVLKPQGVFIGTVSFLEPFHGDSFYHHTHLGTYNCLQEGGFQIECVCPSDHWMVLEAQATMGLFPKMPRLLAKALVMPLDLCHRLWWKAGGMLSREACEHARRQRLTGSFAFVARRE